MEPADTPRKLFVALPIPASVQAEIYRRLEGWPGLLAPWAEFQRDVLMHATMVPPKQMTVQQISRKLQHISGMGPQLATLDCFSSRAPNAVRGHGTLRVMIEPNEGLWAVGAAVQEALGMEKPHFSGHITLAKLGKAAPEGWTEDFLVEFGEADIGDISWTVDEVHVLESDYSRQPVYRVAAVVSLKDEMEKSLEADIERVQAHGT